MLLTMQSRICFVFLTLLASRTLAFGDFFDLRSSANSQWRTGQERFIRNNGNNGHPAHSDQSGNLQSRTQEHKEHFEQQFDDRVYRSDPSDHITSVLDHASGARTPEIRANDPIMVVDVPTLGQNPKQHSNSRPFYPDHPNPLFPAFPNAPLSRFPEIPSQGFSFPSPDIFRFYGAEEYEPWWKGPGVCIDREEIEEPVSNISGLYFSFHTSQCLDTELSHTCTTTFQTYGMRKTYTVSFKCCHGYYRYKNRKFCEKVESKPMMDTLRSMGASMFAELISYTGLTDKFSNDNLTVFCPTDEAIKLYNDDFEENAVVIKPMKRRSADNNDLILAHAVSGFLRSGDFVDEQVLMTENKDAHIRTNVYDLPGRAMTINCVPILSGDQFAHNGVAHLIERVIPPVTKTLGDFINTDKKFTIFKTLLAKSGLDELLQKEGQFTLFAPTDDAFRQMDPLHLRKLLNGEACVSSLLKYHILPNVVCSGILPSAARSVTLLGSDVKIRRDDDEKYFVNEKELLQRDQMATNGVMHTVDAVLIPNEASAITKVLDEWQLTDLLDLMESADMMATVDDMKNITFFAPTNQAIKKAAPLLNELRRSPGKLKDILTYHMAQPATSICHVDNNQQMTTGLNAKSIRFNQFTTMAFGLSHHVTVQCARILEMDRKACGATVQLIEKVLLPPEGHLVDVLSSNQSFSVMRKLLRESDLERELLEHGPYTLLVPTDQAFYSMPEEQLSELMHDKNQIDELLRYHILPEVLCCAGVHQTHWWYSQQRAQTLSGRPLPLRKYHDAIVIGTAHVVTCDIMADNGVVHALNQVLIPPKEKKTKYVQHEARPYIFYG